MKAVLINLGTRGDINPLIAIGMQLKTRGHDVTLISAGIYENLVIAKGLKFISCLSSTEYLNIINTPNLHRYSQQKLISKFLGYIQDSIKPILNIISGIDTTDTILISTPLMVGAKIASEKLNLPLVHICLQPYAIWSVANTPALVDLKVHKLPYFLRKVIFGALDRYFLDRLFLPMNRFRVEIGLKKVKNICSKWIYSNQKLICLFPSWFASIASDWPRHTETTGFIEYSEDKPLPTDLKDFLANGLPPILFTCGTGVTQAHEFFEASVKMVRDLGMRGIFLTQYKEQLPTLNPETEISALYVPLDKVLPKVALIVHPGGIGTLSQAISYKVPQLIIPFYFDQADNGERLEKLGLGMMLSRKKYIKYQAVAEVKELLSSIKVKSAFEKYSGLINSDNDLTRISESIEELFNNYYK